MYPLHTLATSDLLWRQPKFGMDHYELRAGPGLLATISWPRWLSDLAVARCAAASWELDRPDFFRQTVVACPAGSAQEVARAEFDWLKDARLQLADGRAYEFYRTYAFRQAWALVSEPGQLVYEIEFGMRWFKRLARVRLAAPPSTPQLDLLLCLGLYLGCCIIEDAAVVVAATTAAVC
ncbi:MAG: hypothetical protein AB1894_03885 [Chloroflexota bacterium]